MIVVDDKPVVESRNVEWGDESAQIAILLNTPKEGARQLSKWTFDSTDSPKEPMSARASMKL